MLALFDQAIAGREALKNHVIVDGVLRRGAFKIKVAPGNLPVHTAPAVGIFWLVNGVLVFDRSLFAEAERYGDCLTHGAGHYERWEAWRRLGTARLIAANFPETIATTEYDQWPRGRIVYEPPARRFVIYADKRFVKFGLIDAVKILFGLHRYTALVRADSHYR